MAAGFAKPRPISANGGSPTTSATAAEWIQVPRGRKARRRANAAPKATAGGAAFQTAADSPKAPKPAEPEEVTEDPDLTKRIETARGVVAELEKVGTVARASVAGFDQALADAKAEVDKLVQQKRSSRPLRVQLTEADRKLAQRQTALAKASDSLESLRKQEVDLQAKILDQEKELQKAEETLEEARRHSAAVRAAIGRDAQDGGTTVAEALAEGHGFAARAREQFKSLGAATEAGNGLEAFNAIKAQMEAICRATAPAACRRERCGNRLGLHRPIRRGPRCHRRGCRRVGI